VVLSNYKIRDGLIRSTEIKLNYSHFQKEYFSCTALMLLDRWSEGHRLAKRFPAISIPKSPQNVILKYSSNEVVKPISHLRFDYDTTAIRRYQDAFDYDGSDRNYDWRSIWLGYDYDEKLTCSFFCSRRIASNGSRRARYVIVGS